MRTTAIPIIISGACIGSVHAIAGAPESQKLQPEASAYVVTVKEKTQLGDKPGASQELTEIKSLEVLHTESKTASGTTTDPAHIDALFLEHDAVVKETRQLLHKIKSSSKSTGETP